MSICVKAYVIQCSIDEKALHSLTYSVSANAALAYPFWDAQARDMEEGSSVIPS